VYIEKDRARKERNKEKTREYNHVYYLRNREELLPKHKKWAKSTYRLTHKPSIVSCKTCGKEFTRNNSSVYCSAECRRIGRSKVLQATQRKYRKKNQMRNNYKYKTNLEYRQRVKDAAIRFKFTKKEHILKQTERGSLYVWLGMNGRAKGVYYQWYTDHFNKAGWIKSDIIDINDPRLNDLIETLV
jgi:hypothetical protein